jgi:Zn-finger nucleic acid-binding protein
VTLLLKMHVVQRPNGVNCPICNVELKIAGHCSVSVNYCPLCGGTWLDKGGLDRL